MVVVGEAATVAVAAGPFTSVVRLGVDSRTISCRRLRKERDARL